MTAVTASAANARAHARSYPCMRYGNGGLPKPFRLRLSERSCGLRIGSGAFARRRSQPQPQDRGCCRSLVTGGAQARRGPFNLLAGAARNAVSGGLCLRRGGVTGSPLLARRTRRLLSRFLPSVSGCRQLRYSPLRCESNSPKRTPSGDAGRSGRVRCPRAKPHQLCSRAASGISLPAL
jgi:hypothetical protein